MAQNITTTNDTRMCKRVIYEHTRTVQSVFLVPIDAKERELEFEFNDGDTELHYRADAKGPEISMPRVSLEDDDEEYRPNNKWCVTEKVNQGDALPRCPHPDCSPRRWLPWLPCVSVSM